MKVNFKIDGMLTLKKSLERIGKVPQKYVSAAARKGMNITLREARAKAPILTGNLKRGIKLVGERGKAGKKVYRVVFDRAMNDIFQKKNSDGKITGYYPVSQEYGFFTKNGRYIPGFRFTHKALESNTKAVEKTIIDTMQKKIYQEIYRGKLK